MNGSIVSQGWVALTGSVEMVALIVTACALMAGIVKPDDALKHIGAVLGIVIALAITPGIIDCAWSGTSMWQRIALLAIGIGYWWWIRSLQRKQRRKYK
jgi:hypothetical protein